NGASGIAVGMSTNMAPHNLTETVDGIIAYLDNPDIELSELMEHISSPDFPKGGIIYGYEGVKESYENGRGKITMRARCRKEELVQGGEQEVGSEMRYQVKKIT